MVERIPPGTQLLLIAMAAGFALQYFLGDIMYAWFALWPLGTDQVERLGGDAIRVAFGPWQVVTYAFLHGGWIHLFFNAFALYMFGGPIEYLFGTRHYLVYWFVCVIGAALAQLATIAWLLPPGAIGPTVGASGGVFGLLLAFGMMYPRQRIMLLFPPIPMPAWLFVILYGLLELYLGLTSPGSSIAHFAHLGGMVAGIVLIQYWRGKLPLKPKRILTR